MTTTLAASGFLLALLTAAHGQALPYANPAGKGCASGYRSSGGYCAPIDERSAPAIPKVGACPSGWMSGAHSCVKMESPPRPSATGKAGDTARIRSGGDPRIVCKHHSHRAGDPRDRPPLANTIFTRAPRDHRHRV